MISPCFFQKKMIFSKFCNSANQSQKTLLRGVGHFWTVQEAQISSRSETKGYLPSQYTQIGVLDTSGPNLKIFTEKSCHNTLRVVNIFISILSYSGSGHLKLQSPDPCKPPEDGIHYFHTTCHHLLLKDFLEELQYNIFV